MLVWVSSVVTIVLLLMSTSHLELSERDCSLSVKIPAIVISFDCVDTNRCKVGGMVAKRVTEWLFSR